MSLEFRLRRLEALQPESGESQAVAAARAQIEADIDALIVQHNLTPTDVERIAAGMREWPG